MLSRDQGITKVWRIPRKWEFFNEAIKPVVGFIHTQDDGIFFINAAYSVHTAHCPTIVICKGYLFCPRLYVSLMLTGIDWICNIHIWPQIRLLQVPSSFKRSLRTLVDPWCYKAEGGRRYNLMLRWLLLQHIFFENKWDWGDKTHTSKTLINLGEIT